MSLVVEWKQNSKIKNVWISGLSASGKSTLARLFVDELRLAGYPCVLIDGDEIRGLFANKLGYDPLSRRKQTIRIKALAEWIQRQGILPVVAIIHPFEDQRTMCRQEIPGYFEVSLKCDIKECIRRDAKNLYLPAIRGEKRHVVGIDIPFDDPQNPDLVIESGILSPEKMLDALWKSFDKKASEAVT